MKVSIIIAVYNEGRTVQELLEKVWNQELPRGLKKEIVIVESHSTDQSREICERFSKSKNSSNIKLILQPGPKGKGSAIREGLVAATGDIILIQDADLEYDVADYPALLEPILDQHSDFVLGSRHLAAGSWKIRTFESSPLKAMLLNFGGIFFHGLFNIIYGQHLTDPTTMYKVFRKKCVDGLYFSANRFDFDFELLGKLIRAGYPPLEVPVTYVSRSFTEGKKVRIFRDPITWIIAILKYRFARLRDS